MKVVLSIVFLLVISGVVTFFKASSTIRVKYDAIIVDDYFQTAQFEFIKSYPIEDLRKKCLRTFLLFGGKCWEYRDQPDQKIRNEIRRDASKQIEEVFGPNNFGHRSVEISRFGWNDLPTDYRFVSGTPLRNNYDFFYQEPEQRIPPPMPPSRDGIGEQ